MRSLLSIPVFAGARINLIYDNDDLTDSLGGRLDRMRNRTVLMTGFLSLLRADAREQFREGGSPLWPPLAASTVAAKTALGLPARTAKGRIPTRLKQAGVFGPASKSIATGARRDAWGRKDSPNHVETSDADGVSIGSTLFYERWQAEGTRPYVIAPVKMRADGRPGVLAFIGSSGGTVFAKKVHHPGLKPRPVRITPRLTEQARELLLAHIRGEADLPSPE